MPCGYVAFWDRVDADVFSEPVLLPAFHGRGIGTSILGEQTERARGRGVPVSIGTLHENRAAHHYRRLGFRDTGRTQAHIHVKWRSQ